MFFLNFEKSGRGPLAHGKLQEFFQCFRLFPHSAKFKRFTVGFFAIRRLSDPTKINNFDGPFCDFSLLNVLQKIHVYRYQFSVGIRGAFPETIFRIAPPYPHHRHPSAGNRLNLLHFFWIRIYESEHEKI